MKQTTAANHKDLQWERGLFVAPTKEGKTASLVASILGVLPGQTEGGIVDDPKNLHIMAFDMGAVDGIAKFLTQTCGARPEALNFNIYDMKEEMDKAFTSNIEYGRQLFDSVYDTVGLIASKSKGTSVVVVSSLTLLAQAVQREIGGPPEKDKGGGMDVSKWDRLNYLMNDVRTFVHGGNWHALWEGHIYVAPNTAKPNEPAKEYLSIPGKTGQNFGSNVTRMYRIRRINGSKIAGTKCDQVMFDTRAYGGRGFNETVTAQEKDLTQVFKKLGLQVGHWGAEMKSPAANTTNTVVQLKK